MQKGALMQEFLNHEGHLEKWHEIWIRFVRPHCWGCGVAVVPAPGSRCIVGKNSPGAGRRRWLTAGFPSTFNHQGGRKMHRKTALWTMVLALGLVLAFGAAATAAEGAKIDLNKATVEELTTLDRIGEVVAQRIVDYREQNGPFATIEDLKKVKGIGEKVFEANKDRITVSAPAGNK